MLYVNAFVVSRVWYSPAEGGCWYDAGEPIASIPIATTYETGKTYYCEGEEVYVRECYACKGTGEDYCTDDYCDVCGYADEKTDETEDHLVRCQVCGEVPADLEKTATLVRELNELLKDCAGRREEIRVRIEQGFACPFFPAKRPTYE